MDFDEFIVEIIRSFKPTGNYIYDKQVLLNIYETKFGIHNHLSPSGPLASVKFNECEGFHRNFIYESHLRNFIMKDLGKKLNMSFDEFINRPRYEIDIMLEVADSLDRKKNEINNTVLNNLANEVNSNKLKD